jgi:hypothetical protein
MESQQGNGEEVLGDNSVPVVSQEGHPLLGLVRVEWTLGQIPGHLALGHVEAQLEQFGVEARCTPGGILGSHPADQLPDFQILGWPPGFSAFPGEGLPKFEKALPMTADNGFRRDDDQGIASFGPETTKENPEGPIGVGQLGTRLLMLEGRSLVLQGKVLQGQIVSGTEPGHQEPQEQTDDFQ